MSEITKWGILAPGNIAKQFARGLQALDSATLYAAASRTQEKAQAFIDEFGGEKAYGSYQELIADPNVDAIYIASPHTLHMEHALMCLEAKKPVLVEKPMAVNAEQAQTMVDAAKKNNTFLMEAMWTRFFPLMHDLRKIIADGKIGEVRMLQADFAFRCGWNPEGRLLNPDLAGGGLLDVGIYCVSAAYDILGKPKAVSGKAHVGETGVDEQNAFIFEYDNGALAVLTSGVRTSTKHELRIYGTEGSIIVNEQFWKPSSMVVTANGETETKTYDNVGNGYNYEAEAIAKYVAEGKTESDIIPLSESLEMMADMDELRKQWGVVYPFEQPANV